MFNAAINVFMSKTLFKKNTPKPQIVLKIKPTPASWSFLRGEAKSIILGEAGGQCSLGVPGIATRNKDATRGS